MRSIAILTLVFLFGVSGFGQTNKLIELLSEGTALHDQGKYEEAITKYKAALEIDSTSDVINYELSYTYLTIKKYDEAIKYSKRVIEQNFDNIEQAYIILGSSLDMKGQSADAIIIYEEGLSKIPKSCMLNYNLGVTANNLKDYDKAEKAIINAIQLNPRHVSSHLLLGIIMDLKGEHVKSLLSFYYYLMLEPTSKRSIHAFYKLKKLLNGGVSKESDNKFI